MTQKKIALAQDKKIALVAHDNKKIDLIECVKYDDDAYRTRKIALDE